MTNNSKNKMRTVRMTDEEINLLKKNFGGLTYAVKFLVQYLKNKSLNETLKFIERIKK